MNPYVAKHVGRRAFVGLSEENRIIESSKRGMLVMKLFNLTDDELVFLKQGLELNEPLMMVFDSSYENCQVCHSVCATGCGANKS